MECVGVTVFKKYEKYKVEYRNFDFFLHLVALPIGYLMPISKA